MSVKVNLNLEMENKLEPLIIFELLRFAQMLLISNSLPRMIFPVILAVT